MERFFKMLKKTREPLLKLPNVNGVGVGFKQVGMERTQRPALIIFVEKKLPADGLRREHLVPRQINGLDTDVVEIGRVRLLDVRTQRNRPAAPGMSIGHYKISAGTFGAVVRDKKTGEKLILSNNHILANATDGKDGRAAIGDAIYQPGVYDGGSEKDSIATLYRFVPIMRSVQESDCPVAAAAVRGGNALIHLLRPNYEMRMYKKYRGFNSIDCAVARPVDPGAIDDKIIEIGRVEGIANVGAGDWVQKSGRSSGLTSGNVTAVGVTLQVDLSDNETGWFSDQVVCDGISQGGDSGSLIVNKEKQAVGLLFAGSEKYTVFNRIENVLQRLEVEF